MFDIVGQYEAQQRRCAVPKKGNSGCGSSHCSVGPFWHFSPFTTCQLISIISMLKDKNMQDSMVLTSTVTEYYMYKILTRRKALNAIMRIVCSECLEDAYVFDKDQYI